MAKIFLSINADGVGKKISENIMGNDPSKVREASARFSNAHGAIDQWVQEKGGEVISASGDEGIYELEESNMLELQGILEQYKQQTGHSITAGVGSDMLSAVKAMIFGKMHDPGQVIQYDEEVDEAITPQEEQEAEEITEENESQDEQELPEGDEEAEKEDGLEGDEGETEESPKDIKSITQGIVPESEEEDNDEEKIEPDKMIGQGKIDEDKTVEDKKKKDTVEIPKKDFVDEHEKLIDTLISPEHDDDLAEADKQKQELDDVKDEDKEDEADIDESEIPELTDEDADLPKDDDSEELPEEGEKEEGDLDIPPFKQEGDKEQEPEVPEQGLEQEEVPAPEQEQAPEQEEVPAPEQEQEEVPGQDLEQEQSDSNPQHDEIKSKVIDTLMSFKQNKDKIQAMEQSDPETYRSVMEMLNRMIELAKELAPSQHDESIPESDEKGLNPAEQHIGAPIKKPIGGM